MSSRVTAPFEGAIGLTGKIPAKADFLERGLPGSFARPWSAWIDAVMGQGATLFGAEWTRLFRTMPAWRFVLAPGVIGPYNWQGIILASGDSVGRSYPLTIALGSGASPLMVCGDEILDVIEDTALDLRFGQIDVEAALAKIGVTMTAAVPTAWPVVAPTHSWPSAGSRPLYVEEDDGHTGIGRDPIEIGARVMIWHPTWSDRPALRLVADTLPPPDAFASLADRGHSRQGWIPILGAS